MSFRINRRRFLQSASATLAFSTLGAQGVEITQKPRRVGLIGTGWYGKSDVLRLIQVAPVEVVALCDVDTQMLAERGRSWSASGRSRARCRETYSDYREMLRDQELDIVLIGTPDHWHALQMIEAVEAGADVYVQKPISVDVMEGEAMLAAARKHNRVVQVGTQRKSTPHLIEAKKNIVDAGLLGKVGHVEICCYYHMRANGNPPLEPVPDFLDYEMWTGPAPLRPYDGLPHRRWWRTFMEYGNGIMGDMCVHMLDTSRWMLGLGWPKRITSDRRHLRAEGRQVEYLRHANRHLRVRRLDRRLAAPHLGRSARPRLPLGHVPVRRQGNAQGQRHAVRLHSPWRRRADPQGLSVRAREVPGGRDGKGHRAARRPGHSAPHARLPGGHRQAQPPGRRYRRKAISRRPVASWPIWPWT